MTARFHNQAAAFETMATLSTYTAGRGAGPTSHLGGDVTIRFEGRLDGARRSDELLANLTNRMPVWRPTLGFEKALNGSKITTSGDAGVMSD
jgi:hypothetical protein